MTSIVSFDPCTCDPLGEGEALAEAITGAVFDRGAAIQVLFEAAKCLGAEFVRIDEIVGNDIVDALYENSAWREHLTHALKLAEELDEVDTAALSTNTADALTAEEASLARRDLDRAHAAEQRNRAAQSRDDARRTLRRPPGRRGPR